MRHKIHRCVQTGDSLYNVEAMQRRIAKLEAENAQLKRRLQAQRIRAEFISQSDSEIEEKVLH